MEKSPAFRFYAKDFDADTRCMTCQEVGAYTRLLINEWSTKGLPINITQLSRIAGTDNRTFAKMWKATLAKLFTLNDANLYVNKRLEEERFKQAEWREKQVEYGKLGAKKKLQYTVIREKL
jgi:uncharacterized protein YdaU (DUF1376 family)